jgi:hypothetical protein
MALETTAGLNGFAQSGAPTAAPRARVISGVGKGVSRPSFRSSVCHCGSGGPHIVELDRQRRGRVILLHDREDRGPTFPTAARPGDHVSDLARADASVDLPPASQFALSHCTGPGLGKQRRQRLRRAILR